MSRQPDRGLDSCPDGLVGQDSHAGLRVPREPDGYPDRVGCRLLRDGGCPAGSVGGGSVRPGVWQPPVACSRLEREVIKRIKRAKLFVWLREHRHELFDADFQAELAGMYQVKPVGQPPVPPAQLGLATILQAYTGASDDEVLEAAVMDRRWQLVLDCMDHAQAPFSKATLVAFRARLIAHGLDRRLVERTVALYGQATGRVAAGKLRAALDSSPLWGAGRVEDTYNLLGHALRKALGVLARQQGRGLADVASEAGAGLVAGSSLKAALDRDWDDPEARAQALVEVLAALEATEQYLAAQPTAAADPAVAAGLAAAQQVVAQDTTIAADGTPALRQGVAPDRRISVEDAEMRHGRKSRSRLIDGYKRHVLRDLDRGLVPAVGVTPANAPEAAGGEAIAADLAAQDLTLAELHIDRAYLSSVLVRERPPERAIYCKAWPVQAGPPFPKTAFAIDWAAGTVRCPGGVVVPCVAGETARFPAERCAACPLRADCTTSARGRSLT